MGRQDSLPLFDVRPKAPTPPAAEKRKIYTVTELTRVIRESLEARFPAVWVVGEASNVRIPGSGHVYLTLKDAEAQIRVVVFRGVASRLRFEIRDGTELTVFGRVTVYEPRGEYQIIADLVEPKGIGALQLAFIQLKEKLEKEGLFDPARKRPIPLLPQKIGIVTSPTGAAIRDMLNVIGRRFPNLEILLCPVRVQGEGAAEEIAAGIDLMNTLPDLDVLIVGRGGGSLEDLWAFNEEVVARAVFRSGIPVISAVGHERDFTICDFVADVRAATPTEAGELVVPRQDQMREHVQGLATRLAQALLGLVEAAKGRLEILARSYALRRPLDRILQRQQRVDDLAGRLVARTEHLLALERARLSGISERLEGLSPLKVLARGYSITMKSDEPKPLRTAEALCVGDRVRTRLHAGSFFAHVDEVTRG
ncbi:MAG: exodeoxyribonuclease VII large subunit [Planctomycetes bacterium]|nr:exodeoxyribonuclease VII large subunit [Planctomycetota bacterium]